MKATINNFKIDFSKPIDISIPMQNSDENPIAWYLNHHIVQPVRLENWVGKVGSGSSTNFNNISFNPHAHGTHTECLGHITEKFCGINDCLKEFFFFATLISVTPEILSDDLIITKSQIEKALNNQKTEALIIRTLPNQNDKLTRNYSHTNPPYLTEDAAIFMREIGIQHLLIDLPSVDKEKDDGKLLAHKAFWNVKNTINLNNEARINCTITEMIFVNNTIKDGNYLLNLQIVNFANDASPSKPVLYKLESEL